MALLELNCQNQKLNWEIDPAEMHAGNINIDSIKFNFCQLWDGYTKTAVFHRENEEAVLKLLDDTCTCLIPPEVSKTNGLIYVGAFGVDATGKQRATEPICFYLKEGIVTEGIPSDPTPDIYQQIMALCNEAVNTANSVREDADNGAFKGDKGDKGDTGERGEKGESGYTPQKGVDYFDGKDGKDGQNGANGYTPVKGTDYWTEADKAEIKGYVDEAILGGAW